MVSWWLPESSMWTGECLVSDSIQKIAIKGFGRNWGVNWNLLKSELYG